MALIEIADLNDKCSLSLNTDSTKYAIVIKMAQEDLSDILGGEFYAEILAQYPNSFTAANDAFFDPYVIDYLCWQTYAHFIKWSNSDSTPTGERKFKDENSDILSNIEMYAKEKNIQTMVSRYKYRMINYLKLEQSKDSTAFPLYTDTCKEQFSFAITSVDRSSDAYIRVNKSIISNE